MFRCKEGISTHILYAKHWFVLSVFTIACCSIAWASDPISSDTAGIDPSFSHPIDSPYSPQAVAEKPDGHILVGGRNSFIQLNEDGTTDTAFKSVLVTDTVNAIALNPADGKILIGGDFPMIDNAPTFPLARLNPDGSLDPTFKLEFPIRYVRTIEIQPDGQTLVGGSHLLRVDIQGKLDPTFPVLPADVGSFDAGINALALQPDGKILVAGLLEGTNVWNSARLVRLNPDGTSDNTFHAAALPLIWYYGALSVKVQKDGKILMGQSGLVRLNTDGSIDQTFHWQEEFPSDIRRPTYVNAIEIQEDGRIIVGGASYDSSDYRKLFGVVRFHGDGSRDRSLVALPILDPDQATTSTVLDHKGRLLASSVYVERLLLGPTGSPPVIMQQPADTVATWGEQELLTAEVASVSSAQLQWKLNERNIAGANQAQLVIPKVRLSDAGIYTLVASNAFGSVTSAPIRLSVQAVPAGWPDTTFNVGSQANKPVNTTLSLPDGTVIVGGAFTSFNGRPAGGIARLTPAGSRDLGFDPEGGISSSETNSFVRALARQNDGKLIVGGKFVTFNHSVRNGLARLNPDGTLDASFQPPDKELQINAIAIQPDGKILLGGRFHYTDEGFSFQNLVRLNPDGTLDRTLNVFVAGTVTYMGSVLATGDVYDIALQQDGKILAAGNFDIGRISGIACLIRFTPDGMQDTTFNPQITWDYYTEAVPSVTALAIQADGKIIIGGTFVHMGNVNVRSIVRLNANGSLDAQFLSSDTFLRSQSPAINDLSIQRDGKILVGLGSRPEGSSQLPYLTRLLSNGTMDTLFHPGQGPNGPVTSIAEQLDGDIIIGGSFTQINRSPASGIARLYGEAESAVRMIEPYRDGDVFSVKIMTQPGKNYALERSEALKNALWSLVQSVPGDGALKTLVDSGGGFNNWFYRVRVD